MEIFNNLTKKDCFPILNYIAFFVLYILCFVYMNQKYTEIIGFGILFVIHTAFSIFISKDIFNLLNEKIKPNLVVNLSFVSIMVALIFHFVSFILMFIMITTLQTKYTKTRGTPIVLSKTYNNKLNEYKNNIIVVFSLSFIVLMTMFFGYETINIDFSQAFKPTKNVNPLGGLNSSWSMTGKEINPSPKGADLNLYRFKPISFVDFYKLLPAIVVALSSLSIIGISSRQVYISNLFSKLSKKDLI